MNIGQRLRYARKSRKMTQNELAECIGVSRGVITNIEFNKVEKPLPIVTTAICRALATDPDWLIYGKGDMDIHWDNGADASELSKELYSVIDYLTPVEQTLVLQIVRLMEKKR